MKAKVCKKALLLAGSLLVGMSANAQYLRTSYYMESASSRLQMNPGLQPTRGYFNIPIIGAFGVGASSNVLGVSDVVDILDSGNDLFNNDKLYSRLKTNNRLNVNLNTDILSFGWYRGKGFWSVNFGIRLDIDANIQKSMFDYLRQVNKASSASGSYDLQSLTKLNGSFKDMHLNIKGWTEIGVGYSRPITDKLTVGGRVKLLLGLVRSEMKINNFSFNASYNETFSGKTSEQINQMINAGEIPSNTELGTIRGQVDAEISTNIKGSGMKYNSDGTVREFDFDQEKLGSAGAGFGIDLGASYKILDNLTVSASVLDLGFINWTSTTKAVSNESFEETITAENYQERSNKYSNTDFLNMDRLSLREDVDATKKGQTKKLASTVLLAGEYGLCDNKVALGAMYTARFVQPTTLHEVTLSATYRPKNWLNVALSYSPVQASGKSLGFALKLGPVFLGSDYLMFGDNSKALNGYLGISIPMGKSKPSTN